MTWVIFEIFSSSMSSPQTIVVIIFFILENEINSELESELVWYFAPCCSYRRVWISSQPPIFLSTCVCFHLQQWIYSWRWGLYFSFHPWGHSRDILQPSHVPDENCQRVRIEGFCKITKALMHSNMLQFNEYLPSTALKGAMHSESWRPYSDQMFASAQLPIILSKSQN